MKKFIIRISVLVAIMAVFSYYISKNIGTIEKTVKLSFSQSLGYLVVAAIFAFLAFFFLVCMNHTVFQMLGIKRTRLEMFMLQTQALAMNVLVPSAGVSVGVVFAGDAKRRGDSEAASITGVILALVADYASIAILLLIAMVYFYTIGSLELRVVIPTIAFFLITFALFLLIYFAGKNREFLKKLLDWSKRKLNASARFFHRPLVIKNDTVVDNFIDELANAYRIARTDRKPLYLALGYVLLSHFMFLMCIYVLFLSFGIDPLIRVLIAGYAIGVMIVVISPTPNGAGFVEGSMALAYTSMGIPGGEAVAVTLIYRGFSFWLPLLVGFVAVQRRHVLDLVTEYKK